MSGSANHSEKANEIFRVISEEDLTDEVLLKFISSFQSAQLPRLKELISYYLNDTNIKKRKARDETRADNKLSHNFARYISTLIQGYILGKPLTYNHENEALLQQINEFNDINNEQSHNSLMELNLSIYGRAFEMIYTDEEAIEKMAVLDPKEVFVIYDATVQMKPIAAIRLYSITIGEEIRTFIEKYTTNTVTYYESNEEFSDLNQTEQKTHHFNAVPIIEYWNNDERIGDFEPVIKLIDAYDKAQSDTANSMEDFADAYLVLAGQPNTQYGDIQQMKESRVIVLDDPASDGVKPDAFYLTKTYDVAGEEAYKNRLVNDIHKLAFAPDLSDEQFSSNVTGEAMKYKLFILDQLRSTKERLLKEGVMSRYRIVSKVWGIKNKESGIEKLEIVFTPNLPANVKEMVDIINNSPDLSEETKLSNHPLVEDVQAEMERKQKEKEAAMKEFQMQPMFSKQDNEVEEEEEVVVNG
ncbi:phage portal protein [Bacillus toyonensis]|uniref:phage portal protein n=1 Tax=Bacillus toyonensis TaxID=155322 RepID=UPI000BF8FAD5|nr:phage portal protein [Bacillus toyonensis]PFY36879.1 phage portal protein [Bacillus toyonensis]PFY43860.1 phage portal protein [Bacillus toyonensis]PFY73565.1 phage portal protein [Bacillus toyonensis]PHA42887.1 phage portal protein [Bacillus toyonensis]PHG01198.1 phage portal protein [Bacillus toyonensis]